MKQRSVKSLLLKSIAGAVAALALLSTTAYADKPHGITMVNDSGKALTLAYTDTTATTNKKEIAVGESFNLTDFITTENVPQKVELQIYPQGDQPSGDTNYCYTNGSDWYNDPYTGEAKEFPAMDAQGNYIPYEPGMVEQQPFIQASDTVMAFSSDLLTQLGTITINKPTQCFFDNLSPAHKNSAITAYPATATGTVNQPFSYDFANMFDDKVPNPGSPTSGLEVSLISGMPSGFAWDTKPATQISTDKLTGTGPITVLACACDPQLTKDILAPGEAGACGADKKPSCTEPQPAGATTWVDTKSGSIAAQLQIDIISGVFAKNPDEIGDNYTPPSQPGVGATTQQTLLTTEVKSASAQGSITIPVASLFKTSSDTLPVTYSIVSDSDEILGRNDGDNPSTVTPKPGEGGAHWGPVALEKDAANGTPVIHLTSGLSVSGKTLTINMNDPQIQKAMSTDEANANGGVIIQATIHASTSDTSVSDKDAYQTIYVMLDQGSSQVHLIKPRVSAWAYAPTVSALVGGADKPTADAKCTLSGDSSTYSPLSDYVSVINNSQDNDHGLTEITPDIGWIQFNGVSKHWPSVGDIFSNNAVDNPYNGCFASYFKNQVKLKGDNAALGFKFIETMEFDGNLKGYVPLLIDEPNSAEPQTTSLSQVAYLAKAVLQAANPEKMFPNAGISTPSGNVVDGIQFDVEPLPNSGMATTFYKRTADLLARQGKINQLFAFAGADTPGIIMAQGPLGLFLPSMYDVGQTAITAYNGVHGDVSNQYKAFWGKVNGNAAYQPSPNTAGSFPYPASFAGIADPSPLDAKDFTNDQAMDYGCHWSQNLDGAGKDAYLIKSYCNYDLTNSIYNNAIRMNSTTNDQDFETRNKNFLGHYAVAVPGEGSATAWNYQIIYNPRLENASGACDTSKADPCVIASLVNTYTPKYIGLNYTRSTTGDEYAKIAQYIGTHTPEFGTYDVFYASTSKSAVATPTSTPQCSMSLADAAKDPAPTMCDAIVTWHNNGKADQDDQLSTSNFTDSLTTAPTLADSSAHQQGNYTQAIFDFANTVLGKNATDIQKQLLLKNALGTPASNGDRNLGVAIYALSNESVSGCQPNGSHGDNPNCFDAYPLGFSGTDAPAQKDVGIWHAINNYMDGITGQINGGDAPPTPPGSVSVIPNFNADGEEDFVISNLPTGQTCSLQVTYPDGTKSASITATDASASNPLKLTGLTDPINFAVDYPDETYKWNVQCTKDNYAGYFHRYGDKIALWLVNSSGTKTDQLQFNEDGKVASQTYSSMPDGDYTVQYEPKSLNNIEVTDHNSLVTPTLDTSAVTVSGTADSPVHLSFKS